MSDSKDVVETTGVITQIHKGGMFAVEVQFGEVNSTIIAKPAGKLRKFKIKLAVGDQVRVDISPYDLTKGRITYRD